MTVLPLTKVNVSHRSVDDPGVLWLLSNGYRFKFEGFKVFLVKPALVRV